MRWPYPRTPAIGRNLPSSYDEGERIFDARVRARFPIGTSEAELVEALRGQGFSIRSDQDWSRATIMRGVIFRTLWSVRWRAESGRINEIWGVYGVIAP